MGEQRAARGASLSLSFSSSHTCAPASSLCLASPHRLQSPSSESPSSREEWFVRCLPGAIPAPLDTSSTTTAETTSTGVVPPSSSHSVGSGANTLSTLERERESNEWRALAKPLQESKIGIEGTGAPCQLLPTRRPCPQLFGMQNITSSCKQLLIMKLC